MGLAERLLYSRSNPGSIIGNCTNPTGARGRVFESWGGSKIVFVSNAEIFDNRGAGDFASGANGNPNDANGKLYFPDGSYYAIANGLVQAIIDRHGNRTTFTYKQVSGGGANLGTIFVEHITDPLGRRTSISYGARPPSNPESCTAFSDLITYSGFGGASRSIEVRYTQLKCRYRSDVSAVSPRFEIGESGTADNENVLSEIFLPNNRIWRFYYSRYGEIAKVSLPTGAAIEYDFGQGVNANGFGGVHASGLLLSPYPASYAGNSPAASEVPRPRWVPSIYRKLQARRTYQSASAGNEVATVNTEDSRTTYPNFETVTGVSTDLMFSGKVNDLTLSSTGEHQAVRFDRIANQTITEIHKFHGELNGGVVDSRESPARTILWGNAAAGRLKSIPVVYEGKEYFTSVGGKRSVATFWKEVSNGTDVKPCVENTTMLDSTASVKPTASKFFLYDTNGSGTLLDATANVNDEVVFPRQGNATEIFEYSFANSIAMNWAPSGFTSSYSCPATAPGSIVRKAVKKYLQGEYLAVGNKSSFDAGFIGFFHPSLVHEESVQNAAGATLSKTNLSYDAAGVVSRATRRADYCGGQSRKRANVTSVSRLLKGLAPVLAEERTVTENLGYDCVGNLVGYSDAKSKQTDFLYEDNFSGATPTDPDDNNSSFVSFAFLTKTQLPAAQAGHARHELNRKYDLSSGRPVEEKDFAGVVREFTYADTLDRLKTIRRFHPNVAALEQKSDIQYFDTPGSGFAMAVEVAKTQYAANESTKRLLSRTEYDGWGAVLKTVSGRGNPVSTTKSYDGFKRVRTECNPTASGSVGTDGCRSMLYL